MPQPYNQQQVQHLPDPNTETHDEVMLVSFDGSKQSCDILKPVTKDAVIRKFRDVFDLEGEFKVEIWNSRFSEFEGGNWNALPALKKFKAEPIRVEPAVQPGM